MLANCNFDPQCLEQVHFEAYGIPSTDEQMAALLLIKMIELCNGPSGACTTKKVGLFIGAITFPISVASSGLSALGSLLFGVIGTSFEVGDSAIRGEYGDALVEIALDGTGEGFDRLLQGFIGGFPAGGLATALLDLHLDVEGLDALARNYSEPARDLVNQDMEAARLVLLLSVIGNSCCITTSSLDIAPMSTQSTSTPKTPATPSNSSKKPSGPPNAI
jgi:hypothetical protein